MTTYEQEIQEQLRKWQKAMVRRPGFLNKMSKRLQTKINSYIPEKVHAAITTAIRHMIKGVLFGAEKINSQPLLAATFEGREQLAEEKISFYQKTASIEGGLTGAGGILWGLADFPLLLTIKIKLLFEIAAAYGFDVTDYKERLYILYIFQLAFCSAEQRRNVYLQIAEWSHTSQQLPSDINQLDWRTLQQEYRDYIDLAKMAQLVPVIGAPVGAIVNYRLIRKLGETAKNAYRMRVL